MDEATLKSAVDRVDGGVDHVVELATRVARRIRAGAPLLPARVTLHLRNGHRITGVFVERIEDARDPAVVIQVDDAGRPTEDLIWVRPSAIDAVTLHDAPVVGTRLEGEPLATPLQLRRRATEVAAELSALIGQPLEIELGDLPAEQTATDGHLRAVQNALEEVPPVLEEIAGGPVGRDVMRQRVKQLRLTSGEHPEVTRTDSRVTIVVPRDPLAWPTRRELRDRLEAVL